MLVQARVDHVDIIFVRQLSGKVWLAKTAPPIIVHTCIIFIWSVLGPIYDWERVVEDAISGGWLIYFGSLFSWFFARTQAPLVSCTTATNCLSQFSLLRFCLVSPTRIPHHQAFFPFNCAQTSIINGYRHRHSFLRLVPYPWSSYKVPRQPSTCNCPRRNLDKPSYSDFTVRTILGESGP